MKTSPLLLLVAVGAILSAVASNADAAIIYSNLGPGDSFANTGGYLVEGVNENWPEQSIASSFDTGHLAWNFTGAELALASATGSNSFELRVMSDAGGLPGQILQSIPFSGVPIGPSLVSIYADGSLVLNANTTYWIGVFAISDSTCAWAWDNAAVIGAAFRHDLVNWTPAQFPQGAMRISGSSVPEPSSLMLLCYSGAFCIAARRAGHKN
jgi:hypothetical protein